MKKGDIKKQEILTCAESLFCKQGYEQTSIQDILDRLKASKGSFYHHFAGKESLLEGICRVRAENACRNTVIRLDDSGDPIDSLNTVFSGMLPLSEEKISFLLMILRIFNQPEGRTVRQSFCDALSEQFLPLLSEKINTAHRAGCLNCSEPELTADLILFMLNRLWILIFGEIASAEEKGGEAGIPELLRITDQYRIMIERTLMLPFGSVILLDITSLRYVSEQIHNHWPVEPVS